MDLFKWNTGLYSLWFGFVWNNYSLQELPLLGCIWWWWRRTSKGWTFSWLYFSFARSDWNEGKTLNFDFQKWWVPLKIPKWVFSLWIGRIKCPKQIDIKAYNLESTSFSIRKDYWNYIMLKWKKEPTFKNMCIILNF